MTKLPLDQRLVDLGFADSKAKAQGLILSGNVLVNDRPVDKSKALVDSEAAIRLKVPSPPFVSRGGLKLNEALKAFQVDVAQKICMDVGASTGGFTDCLLQAGAKKVYAIDVGYGQFAWKLRNDPKVILLEKHNIRHLGKTLVPDPIELVVIDVSFISLKAVFPSLLPFLAHPSQVVALIKPQFEVAATKIGKKGVVSDGAAIEETKKAIEEAGKQCGWTSAGMISSPILGAEGNQEFLILFQVQ